VYCLREHTVLFSCLKLEGLKYEKGKILPVTGCEGPEGE
jgi:hypothetical protein